MQAGAEGKQNSARRTKAIYCLSPKPGTTFTKKDDPASEGRSFNATKAGQRTANLKRRISYGQEVFRKWGQTWQRLITHRGDRRVHLHYRRGEGARHWEGEESLEQNSAQKVSTVQGGKARSLERTGGNEASTIRSADRPEIALWQIGGGMRPGGVDAGWGVKSQNSTIKERDLLARHEKDHVG